MLVQYALRNSFHQYIFAKVLFVNSYFGKWKQIVEYILTVPLLLHYENICMHELYSRCVGLQYNSKTEIFNYILQTFA